MREKILFCIFVCIILASVIYIGLLPSTEEVNLAETSANLQLSLDRVYDAQQMLADYVVAVAWDLTKLVGGEFAQPCDVRCVTFPLEDDTFLRLIYELSEKLGVDAPRHTYDMVIEALEELE